VNIKGVFDAVDPSAFAAVQLAIEDKDSAAFTSAYKQALEACYTCHTASGKPYLRPVVPTAPPSTLISPDVVGK
jgi:cytochrome c553